MIRKTVDQLQMTSFIMVYDWLPYFLHKILEWMFEFKVWIIPLDLDIKLEGKNEANWTNTDQNEATSSGKDPLISTDEDTSKKKSSPIKKVKKKIRVKQAKSSSNIHQKVLKVKKKDKKLTLTKDELTKVHNTYHRLKNE